METATRPHLDRGKATMDAMVRNIWCPEYDDCLSAAALQNLELDCRGCALENTTVTQFVLTLSEIEGCKALVNAIFCPRRS